MQSIGAVVAAADKTVESLDFDVVTDDVIGTLSSKQFYEFSDGLEKLPTTMPAEAALGHGKPNAEKAKAFAVVLKLKSGGEIRLFQSLSEGFVVSRKLLAVFEGSSNRLYKATDRVIQLPDNFSMIEYDGSVFVLHEKRFSALSSFDKYVTSAAEAAFDTLKKNPSIDIENLQEFKDELFKSSEFMRRLASADKVGALQNRDINKMLDDVLKYDIEVSAEIKAGKLRLTPNVKSRKGRRDIVDLLADKITHSLSSGVGYRMQKGAPLAVRPAGN